jgi:beta-lactamase class A
MVKLLALLAVLMVFALSACTASAETLDELKGKIDKIAQGFHGTLGYSLHFRGKHDERISLNGDETFPTASTIKTAVMCETMHQIEQGKVKWDQKIPVQEKMDDRQEGGLAYGLKEGTALTICDWVNAMITHSDNTATMNLREFLGQKNVNDWLESHGFKTTRLLNGKKCDELGLRPLQRKWGLGKTAPNEMVQLFELILDNKAGSPASCERMQRILSHQFWDDYILSQIPPSVHAGSKSGAIDQSRSDVAFVDSPGGQYILAIYTKDNQDESWGRDNEADKAIRAIGALVWRHYNPKHPWQPPQGWETLFPTE